MNTAEARLKFAVGFADLNLDALRPGDWLNLREDLARFLGFAPQGRDTTLGAMGGAFTDTLMPPYPQDYPKDLMHTLQAEVKGVMRALIETRRQIPAQRAALEKGGVRFGPPFHPAYVVPQPAIRISVRPAWFDVANPTPAAADRNILWVSGSVRDVFVFVLAFLLAQEPRSRFQECPGCGRLFYRIRRQRYCSRPCVNRANLRAYRARAKARETPTGPALLRPRRRTRARRRA